MSATQESAYVATSTAAATPPHGGHLDSLWSPFSRSLSLALRLSVRPPRVHSGCCSTVVVATIFLFALVGFVFVVYPILSLSGIL